MIPIQTKPTRTWFQSHGYTKADTAYTNGHAVWLHPETNDVLSVYGTKLTLRLLPKEKHKATATRYLALSGTYGNMYLARLKYLTFVGPIKEGEVIDHIDGNTLNNAISNLRAIPDSINRRDGGFLKKLRNHGINVAMFPKDVILAGYERIAEWKATHKYWQYRNLTRDELLRIFVGPHFAITDPTIAAGEEPDKYL